MFIRIGDLQIECSSNEWDTTIKVTGTTPEVEKYTQNYFSDYHPSGYGTSVISEHYRIDGTVTVTLTRSNCCD